MLHFGESFALKNTVAFSAQSSDCIIHFLRAPFFFFQTAHKITLQQLHDIRAKTEK